ncbi:amino acid racemase [Lichenicola cladoniae]|uniref:Amino acid racemase n=1 Tax=Lichenicola cladoniae TaxID=1484109 RepID=A0A6M8HLI2_9PROT|nr:amino acid racemase [Lichenicola cladoniae]NPD66042.1 amino acid racemase [Acetobacteraceae bacterium]QKE89223.1 amino acid racemase [Lichenicola cladoniae]
MATQPKLIGVLGGMGPAATAEFMQQVIGNTVAETDQGHVPMLVFSDPSIPDRSTAILDVNALSPLPALRDYAQRLERAGSTVIVIPCNTAHHFYALISAAVGIPVLHIADAVIRNLEDMPDGVSRNVAVMATAGTVASGFYQTYLDASGRACLIPDRIEQALISHAIYEIKASRVTVAVLMVVAAARLLRLRGATCVILGCTELASVRQAVEEELPVVDSTQALALACVRYGMAQVTIPNVIQALSLA